MRLERAGMHTLRFDYLGTGDSAGDVEQASPAQWVADVKAAVEEIQGRLPASSVTLVGLRLGATLAAVGPRNFAMWRVWCCGSRSCRNRVPPHGCKRVITNGFRVSFTRSPGLSSRRMTSYWAPASPRISGMTSHA